VKLTVEEASCMGHGRCYRIAPSLLGCDDEGYVSTRGLTIEVPEDQVEVAQEAADTCPEGAISVSAD
jgi:ferredoxin